MRYCVLLLCLLLFWGCGGDSSTVVSSDPPAPPPATSSLLLRLAIDGLEPDVAQFRVRVTDAGGFLEVTPEVVQERSEQGGVQEITLADLPQGFVSVLLEALDGDGLVLSSFIQEVELTGGQQTVTFTQLIARAQTREIGLVSAGANGLSANGPSLLPAISGDGRFVAFACSAPGYRPDRAVPGLPDRQARGRRA